MVPANLHDEFVRLESTRSLESFQRAEKILREVGIEAVQVTCLGQPADEITRHAKESNADLIIVGAHGMSLLEHFLIGSTSETVALHAPCSVLLVLSIHSQNAKSGEPPNMTVASDGSEADRLIPAQVNALCLSNDTRINLISVIEHPYLLEAGYEYDSQSTRETALALDRLATELAASSDHIEKHVFEKLHVASCILNHIGTHPMDIVVVGDKGRSAINRFFLGSVSRVLLRHAACFVLLIRTRLEATGVA